MNIFQWILSTLLLISELGFWLGVGRLVLLLSRGKSQLLAWVLSIFSVAILLTLWGFFFSPKARYRLSPLPRTLLIVIGTFLTGFGLYKLGDKTFGLILMIGATIIQAIGQLLSTEPT